jgi:hypothetical protein
MDVVHRNDVDKRTLEWWDGLCRETTVAMQDYLMPYVTPISLAVSSSDGSGTEGALHGTGSYILWAGKRLLVTNEHILRDWKSQQFGHQFQGCDKVFGLDQPLALEGDPVDAGICVIGDQLWEQHASGAQVIPPERIAERHAPVPGELLFLTGYPGARAGFAFDTLFTPATRLLTQALPPERPLPGLHANYFPLVYAPARAESVDPKSGVPLSLPPGLSGSLVWNTHRIDCEAQKRSWTPYLAQVTGMLCSWIDKSPIVVATRIEAVREFLGKHLGASS